MYFYLARNGRFCHRIEKTTGVTNALIRIDVSFDDDCNFIITNVKRNAGTELSKLLETVQFIIKDARRIGCSKIICNTNKLPICFLHKIGFETINNLTFFNLVDEDCAAII